MDRNRVMVSNLLQELFVRHTFVTILAGRLSGEKCCKLLIEVDEILSVLPPLKLVLCCCSEDELGCGSWYSQYRELRCPPTHGARRRVSRQGCACHSC